MGEYASRWNVVHREDGVFYLRRDPPHLAGSLKSARKQILVIYLFSFYQSPQQVFVFRQGIRKSFLWIARCLSFIHCKFLKLLWLLPRMWTMTMRGYTNLRKSDSKLWWVATSVSSFILRYKFIFIFNSNSSDRKTHIAWEIFLAIHPGWINIQVFLIRNENLPM